MYKRMETKEKRLMERQVCLQEYTIGSGVSTCTVPKER